MCSSPKSQSRIKISKVATSGMSQGQWAQFAAVANAAEERRQKRKVAAQALQQQKKAQPERVGSDKAVLSPSAVSFSVFSFLKSALQKAHFHFGRLFLSYH